MRAGGPPGGPGEEKIGNRGIVRLNDAEQLREEVKPWPPPGGLRPGEDPFASPEEAGPDLAGIVGASAEEAGGRRPFTLDAEWAAALSVIAHLLILLLVLVMPPTRRPLRPDEKVPDPLGLVKLFETPPPEPPIPVQFFPAPGPASPRPGRNPLPSDADRVAHGGDVTQPRSETPRSRAGEGIRDLAPGDRGQRTAAPPPGQGGESARAREGEETPAAERPSPDGLGQPASADRLKGLRTLSSSPLSGLTAEQVARLAQSDGSGGEGGGGWERDGGFVDSGPLSFDTAEYDWGPYAAEMVRRIKLNWDVPTLAHYGVKGRVTIRFYIRKDGRVEGATILSSSGIPPFDNAAFQAILRSNPFRPLPADLGHDREGVTVTFFYNIRPEDAARK